MSWCCPSSNNIERNKCTNVYSSEKAHSYGVTQSEDSSGTWRGESMSRGEERHMELPAESWLIPNPMLHRPVLKKLPETAVEKENSSTTGIGAVEPNHKQRERWENSEDSPEHTSDGTADTVYENVRPDLFGAIDAELRNTTPRTRLSGRELCAIMRLLPRHLANRQLRPIYSTEADGFSLKKLRQRCEMIGTRREQLGSSAGWDEGCLVIIGTREGARFGAYLSCLPVWGSSRYQGTHATFLFKLCHDSEGSSVEPLKYKGFGAAGSNEPQNEMQTYRCDGSSARKAVTGNKYYFKVEDPWDGETALSVGGGGGTRKNSPALKLFRHGTRVASTGDCPTFFPDYVGAGPLFESSHANTNRHGVNEDLRTHISVQPTEDVTGEGSIGVVSFAEFWEISPYDENIHALAPHYRIS